MPRTTHQRAERCLRLILGMRLPRVAIALRPYGFSQAVIAEGWTLMMALTEPSPADATTLPQRPSSGDLHRELSDFAGTWFSVSSAVLARSHPEQGALLDRGLSVTGGRSLLLAINLFVERLESMSRGDAPFGQDGPCARAVLREHGLSEDVVRNAAKNVELSLEPMSESTLTRSLDEEAVASDVLWAWYLQWSQIARRAIKNKSLLHALGFEPAKRKGGKGNGPLTPSLADGKVSVRLVSSNRPKDGP